jgi:hypothetical protein
MNRRTPPPSFAWTAAFAAALMLVLPSASIAAPGQKSGPVNAAAPVVTGAAVQDATLTVSNGDWSGGVSSYSYEWQRCSSSGCAPIAGAAGNSYTSSAADVGSSIRAIVTATNKRGSSSTSSDAVGPVAPAPASGAPPTVVSSPTISGTPQEGQTLSASTGTWSNSPTSFAYQWSFCSSDGSCSPFSSGNGLATYTLSLVDVGYTVRVTVTASNSFGSGSSASASTAVVSPKPAPAPSVSVAIPSPTAGATISGSVYFTATVTGALPQRVEMTVDGAAMSTEYEAPYYYNGDGNTLNTLSLSNGSHVLAARAVFADGTSATKSVSANVQNTASAPTTGTHFGSGLLLFRYGDSWKLSPSTGYDRYGVVVVGYGDDASAAALPTAKALTYKGGVDVVDCASADACLGGVTYQEASANGWLLRDSSGTPVRVGTYGNYGGAIGNPAFQQRWISNVLARLNSKGLDGVFIDNVTCTPFFTTTPTLYPDKASFSAAYISFLTAVHAAFQAQGKYMLTNTFCYGPDDKSANNAWWTQVAPLTDGLITETFEQNPNNYADVFYECPTCSWLGNWKNNLTVLDIANAAGKDAFALSTVTPGSAQAKYTRASFLLKWNGTSGGFAVNLGGTDPWDPNWTYDVGTPTGAMTASGAAYYRTYSKGKVIVNPSPTQTVTVLGVTLGPKTAYIGV